MHIGVARQINSIAPPPPPPLGSCQNFPVRGNFVPIIHEMRDASSTKRGTFILYVV